MSKQYNKAEKRMRRKRYLKRRKTADNAKKAKAAPVPAAAPAA
jgi:hypothetical protein